MLHKKSRRGLYNCGISSELSLCREFFCTPYLGEKLRAYFGSAWRAANVGHLSPAQRRVMRTVELCRTAELGGHVEQCADCAHARIAYNSCRNRHCSKCQWTAA